MLIGVRFLFGAGEAGALPNAARVIARWFPPHGRGPAQGLIMTAALVGGAASPMLCQWLIKSPLLGWRGAFVVLGLPGLIWAAAFYYWFRDDPAVHPAVNDGERRLLEASRHARIEHPHVAWSFTLRQPNLWLLGGITTCCAFTTYLFFSWYPTYLKEGRLLDADTAGWYAGFVLAGGALGSISGGFLADRLLRRTGRRRIRCVVGVVCLAIAGAAMGVSQLFDRPWAAVSCAALASYLIHVQLAGWWGVVADLSGRHLGALFGFMNSLGVIGAFASQVFLGKFVDWLKDRGYTDRDCWDPAFYIYGGLLLLGSVSWLLVATERSLIKTHPESK
jgi:MFS family permease